MHTQSNFQSFAKKILITILFYAVVAHSNITKNEDNILNLNQKEKENTLSNILDLSEDWYGSSPNKPGLEFKSTIPFTIHSALLKGGQINDPYFRYNDNVYRWVATSTWLLVKKYYVSEALLTNYKHFNIVFKQVDTVADIYLNNVLIGSCDNKFVSYSFDVTKVVQKGQNTISVWLKSPIEYAKLQSLMYRDKYNYSVLPNCYPEALHGECHSNFIRKEPCSFGWDFGPSIPTQGLTDTVFFEGINALYLTGLRVETAKSGTTGTWTLSTIVRVESANFNRSGFLQYELQELGVTKKKEVMLHQGLNDIKDSIMFDNAIIKPWWPNGYGEQKLYNLKVSLLGVSNSELAVNIGFRTVELIQEPIPQSKGLSFYFKINSIPIFLKGSNWIPANALRDMVNDKTIDYFLQSAVDANMNVLRVWGGGGYESDHFYNQCDQLGLLIWQDFMFACAMYPVHESFLASVRAEENWYGTDTDFKQYKSDYIKLYVDTVKPLVAGIDVTRPFIVSSPSNAAESESEGWIAKNPHSPYYGDVHVYDYKRNCWDVDIFPKPRLASEYGYQSYPSVHTWSNVTVASDLKWNSSLMFYRQHHPDGNKQIGDLIQQNFHLPVSGSEPEMYFKQMVYMSQIVQALCVTYETEHYRRLMGRLEAPNKDDTNLVSKLGETNANEDCLMASYNEVDEHGRRMSSSDMLGHEGIEDEIGPKFKGSEVRVDHAADLQGHTMGAMFWQLNDIWQAPSWASIEYGGRWKMLHYYAKKFFAPIIPSGYVKDGAAQIFVISDHLHVIKRAILNLTLHSWTSFENKRIRSYVQDIQPQTSMHIASVPLSEACADITSSFMLLRLFIPEKPDVRLVKPIFLAPFHNITALEDPKIVVENNVTQVGQNVIQFTIQSLKPAAFVWLSTSLPGLFSDNGFVMYEEARMLNFTANSLVDKTTEVLSGKSDGKDDGKELVSEICGLDMIPKVTEKQLEEEQPNEKTEKEDTPDDSTLEHGDILMTKEQAKTFKENEKQKRAVIKHLPASHNFRWNTKTIPFHLDASLTADSIIVQELSEFDGLKDVIKKAHKVFEMYTCIEFNEVDANSQTFHIRYKKAAG
eukprot:gene8644-9576_t